MKIVNFMYDNYKSIGVLENDLIYDFRDSNYIFNDLIDLINNYNLEDLKINKEKFYNLNDCILLAPIEYPRQDIICLGLNYEAHKEESARFKLEKVDKTNLYPVYFSKRANRIITDKDYILGHFDIVDSLDYESELAFIISKDCKNVSKEDAFNYVFGYMVLNDVSARNIQKRHVQWYLGKSLDTFTVTSNYLVTRDEIKDFNLKIQSYVNGELRQDSNLNMMIFDIPFIISDLSKCMTLKAGTIISTGTPSGVGMGFNPPRFLSPGDKVKCVIENIGMMENEIKKG